MLTSGRCDHQSERCRRHVLQTIEPSADMHPGLTRMQGWDLLEQYKNSQAKLFSRYQTLGNGGPWSPGMGMSKAAPTAVSKHQVQRGSPGRALDPCDEETETGVWGTKERAAQRQSSYDPQRLPRSIQTEHSFSCEGNSPGQRRAPPTPEIRGEGFCAPAGHSARPSWPETRAPTIKSSLKSGQKVETDISPKKTHRWRRSPEKMPVSAGPYGHAD